MSTLKRVDFHDRGPPNSGKVKEFASLMKECCEVVYELLTNYFVQMDLETDMTDEELQRFIVDKFQFIGAVYIESEVKIVQEEHHHGNTTNI